MTSPNPGYCSLEAVVDFESSSDYFGMTFTEGINQKPYPRYTASDESDYADRYK